MDWHVYITTCRRDESTLHDTVLSLAAAGWPDVRILTDTHKIGSRNMLLRACQHFYDGDPGPDDKLFLAQDDVRFVADLRPWIDDQLHRRECLRWPGVISLWLPEILSGTSDDWWIMPPDDLPRRAYGALAYVMRPEMVGYVLEFGNHDGKPNVTDQYVGKVCKELRLPYWYPPRSFCQHTGRQSTISQGLSFISKYRRASDDWAVACGYNTLAATDVALTSEDTDATTDDSDGSAAGHAPA